MRDTGLADTGAADTGRAATGRGFTGRADTGRADTGADGEGAGEDGAGDGRTAVGAVVAGALAVPVPLAGPVLAGPVLPAGPVSPDCTDAGRAAAHGTSPQPFGGRAELPWKASAAPPPATAARVAVMPAAVIHRCRARLSASRGGRGAGCPAPLATAGHRLIPDRLVRRSLTRDMAVSPFPRASPWQNHAAEVNLATPRVPLAANTPVWDGLIASFVARVLPHGSARRDGAGRRRPCGRQPAPSREGGYLRSPGTAGRRSPGFGWLRTPARAWPRSGRRA